MNTSFLEMLGLVLSSTWRLLTSVHYPGTRLSIAEILVGLFVAYFSLHIVSWILTRSFSMGSLAGSNTRLGGGRINQGKPKPTAKWLNK